MPFDDALAVPYRDVAMKLALAVGIGLLIGLEREWARKEVGVRAFAITALLGVLAAMLGVPCIVAVLMGVLVLVVLLNVHSLQRQSRLETTTSSSLIAVYLLGALIGEGHFFTASASAIVVTMLLAWKSELTRFAGALQPEEVRGAALLGLLSVIIYPLLPDEFLDPWKLVNPRQAWTAVVVIAGIGFLNYVLLRLYGARGLFYAALLGGLVNSTAAVAEISASFARSADSMVRRAVAALLLTNVAMCLRNFVLLVVFAPAAGALAAIPLGTMAATAATASWLFGRRAEEDESSLRLSLASPVSLRRVLKFGLLFLILAAVGTLTQRYLGAAGFLAMSAAGGLISSASTTALASALAASGTISHETAGAATVLTSVASALVDLPMAWQQTRSQALILRLTSVTAIMVLLGLAAAALCYLA